MLGEALDQTMGTLEEFESLAPHKQEILSAGFNITVAQTAPICTQCGHAQWGGFCNCRTDDAPDPTEENDNNEWDDRGYDDPFDHPDGPAPTHEPAEGDEPAIEDPYFTLALSLKSKTPLVHQFAMTATDRTPSPSIAPTIAASRSKTYPPKASVR